MASADSSSSLLLDLDGILVAFPAVSRHPTYYLFIPTVVPICPARFRVSRLAFLPACSTRSPVCLPSASPACPPITHTRFPPA